METKKPYVKPGIVFENAVTGELTGTPEMIEKFMREATEVEHYDSAGTCPFEDASCMMRGS